MGKINKLILYCIFSIILILADFHSPFSQAEAGQGFSKA